MVPELSESEVQATPARRPRPTEDEETPDMNNVAMKIERAKEIYREYNVGFDNINEEKPRKYEVFGWYFYGLCSYFVLTVLIPIMFPLIIGQTVPQPQEPTRGWFRSYRDLQCRKRETLL